MCGIIGLYNIKDSSKVIFEKLKALEYRGYDSSGISFLEDGKIKVKKEVGNIQNLIDKTKLLKDYSLIIGHTRWATHGKVSKENSHPHLSQNGNICVVHNGIINNFSSLRRKLEDLGVEFKSETDTEVISNLLEFESKNNGDFLEVLKNVYSQLEGSFALAILKADEDRMYFMKKDSPLYVAFENGRGMISSDAICFVENFKDYFVLENGDYGVIHSSGLEVYSKDNIKLERKREIIDDFERSANKKDFSHFMLKEIFDTPTALKNLVRVYEERLLINNKSKSDIEFFNKFKNIKKVKIVGCGTAYHSGMIGAKYFKDILKMDAEAIISSEFIYEENLIDEKTLCIFVSQSGETADTLLALNRAKKEGALCMALTNVNYSTIARNVDFVLPILAGKEVAVASTKAYSNQVASLYVFVNYLYYLEKVEYLNFNYMEIILDEVLKISEYVEFILKTYDKNYFQSIIEEFNLKNENKAFFIGKGYDYICSLEASLKLKEISYINTVAYPSGELKHGSISLIEENTPLFAFSTNFETKDLILNAMKEVNSRGGKCLLLSTNNSTTDFQEVNFSGVNKRLDCILLGVYFQLLSYYVSVEKNINPDRPRNLAKSVTVE